MMLMAFLFASLVAFFQIRAQQNIKQFKKHRFSETSALRKDLI